jgi:glycerol-3-phosphate O-acyltransferase
MRANKVVRDHFLRKASLIQDLLRIEHFVKNEKESENKRKLLKKLINEADEQKKRKPKEFQLLRKAKKSKRK